MNQLWRWFLVLACLCFIPSQVVFSQNSKPVLPKSVNIPDDITPTRGDGTVFTKRSGANLVMGTINVPGDYSTIQDAIDNASPGDVINVAAGTYTENIIVTKSLTISGAGAGSTILIPALSAPMPGAGSSLPAGASNVILVRASDVTIHDLTLDGDNPGLTSGQVFGGADIDARNGIITDHTAGVYNNLEVYNVEIANIYLRGIYASSGGSFYFHDNSVENVQAEYASIAMFNFGGSGTFENNTVSDANDAISANWSKGTRFINNVVNNCGSGVHTDNNGGSGGVADTIRGNTVTNSPLWGYGVWVFFPYLNTVLEDNIVTSVDVGLFAWGGAGGTGQFINNSVDGMSKSNSMGTYITTGTNAWASWKSSVISTMTGNTLENNDYAYVLESETGYSMNLTVASPTESGNLTDISVAGQGSITTSGLSGNTVLVNFLAQDPSAPTGRVMDGIGLVNAGGTVTLVDATFEEQVEIAKTLTLEGAGAGSTTVLSPTTLTKYFTTSANNYPVVYIHDAVDVTVKDLTVDGAGRGNSNYKFVGIGFRNAGGTVEDCELKDIRDTPFSGAQHGVALYAYNDDLTPRSLNVLNNTITGFQKNAMALNAGATTPLAVNVDGNTITGAGPTTVTAQNGVQVWADMGSGTVTGNTITGIAYDNTAAATKWVATSILNYYGDVDIVGNTVSNAHVGVYNIDGSGQINDNDITIEKIGVYAFGIIATDPPDAVPSPYDEVAGAGVSKEAGGSREVSAALTVEVSGNELTFSGIDNTATYGIEADAGYGPNDLDFTATNNVVAGFETGFAIYQVTDDVGVFTAVAINGNSVTGATDAVYSDLTALTVDASGNWYGTNTPAGVAAVISGDVDYTPWLDSGTDTDLGTAGFQGDFSTLWVDDDSPQSGSAGRIGEGIDLVTASTVNVAAGTYTENILVDKKVSIIGAGSDPAGTTITQTAGGAGDSKIGVVQIAASGSSGSDPVLLQDLRILPVGMAGISVGKFTLSTGVSVAYLKFDNVKVYGTSANPATEQERGFYVDLTSSVDYLEVVDCAFDDLTYGWYLQKSVSADASTVQNLTVTNTTFNHNILKGFYSEKLENASFTGCTWDQNGYTNGLSIPVYFLPWMSGIDINLKAGTYQDIFFDACTITANGLGGAKEGVGITLKARDDGATYGAFPATLDNVSILNSTITGNERGARFGEPGKNNAGPTNVEVHLNVIADNVQAYGGSDGSMYGGLINMSLALNNATSNYWGTLHGPADPTGTDEVPKLPWPDVADAKNTTPASNLGNAVSENVLYYPWVGPATGHANGGIWAGGYVNPTSNDILMAIDAGALDGVDPMDTVAPPPPPSDYLYLYFLLDPGAPIENYAVDVKKDEASLSTTAKGWDLRAVTDHTSETVTIDFALTGLPSGFNPTLYDLTTDEYQNLADNPSYEYESPATVVPSEFRILIGDSTNPSVAVTYPNGGEYLIAGTSYDVTWTSSDATGVLRHYVYYSGTGAAPYTLLDSTDGDVFTYSWTPGAAAAAASIKVTARDSVMNEETDVSDYTFTVLASNSIAYNAAAGWNLVSVPMLQGDMSPAGVFGDDYGATPYFTFGFSPSSGYTIPATMNMGQGYWLGSNSAQAIDAVGTPLTGASLALVSGFNIIGNPFASDMDVDDLAFTDGFDTYDIVGAATAGWLSNVLYGYSGGSYYTESSTLELWNGYWVPMLVDGITAEYTPTVASPSPKAVPVVVESDPLAWTVDIAAAVDLDGHLYGDRIAAFGVRSDATEGFNARYDAPRPPRGPAQGFIEISFAGDEDDMVISRFGTGYGRKFMPPDRAGWEIVVTSSGPGEVTLTWDNALLRELPADVKIDLHDAAARRTIDMKNASSYTYTQGGTERRFTINRESTILPGTFDLAQNYPNPFNPTTTISYGLPSDATVRIEVFDFLGQKVATLASGDAVQSAGYHEVVFDAAGLASGMYYYRITALSHDGSSFTEMRKMILMK